MGGCLPGWKEVSRRPRRSGLHHWLKFVRHFEDPTPVVRWQSWVDDYASFLRTDRALAVCTQRRSLFVIGRFLAFQFRSRALRWDRIRVEDLYRYAAELGQTQRPKSINDTLSILRQFFRFVHLRGSCSPALVRAVPTVADYGRRVWPAVLDDDQRRILLAAFDRERVQGRRDYAIALCLLDLGLRAIEVSRLRLDAIRWQSKSLMVPPAKASRGRQLPLPAHLACALRQYIDGRPKTDDDHLFVGERLLRGRPLSSCAIGAVINRAYWRCGLAHLCGTHRLRHSFATRLYARGCTTKEIADLLGHRLVATTDRYTQTDDLRGLAQPWPG
jgi:integrase/recombinase XerD